MSGCITVHFEYYTAATSCMLKCAVEYKLFQFSQYWHTKVKLVKLQSASYNGKQPQTENHTLRKAAIIFFQIACPSVMISFLMKCVDSLKIGKLDEQNDDMLNTWS